MTIVIIFVQKSTFYRIFNVLSSHDLITKGEIALNIVIDNNDQSYAELVPWHLRVPLRMRNMRMKIVSYFNASCSVRCVLSPTVVV